MTVVPADGETLGEVMFRGNIVMKGYLKNPAATDEAFAGGWFHSGDLGVLYPDGYIQLKDRSKDIIISGGENISSIEVEDVLYKHPAVACCAVVAKPDEKWGETPCAFVELRPGASATVEELVAWCRRGARALQVPAPHRASSTCRAPRRARSRSSSCGRWRRRLERSAPRKRFAAPCASREGCTRQWPSLGQQEVSTLTAGTPATVRPFAECKISVRAATSASCKNVRFGMSRDPAGVDPRSASHVDVASRVLRGAVERRGWKPATTIRDASDAELREMAKRSVRQPEASRSHWVRACLFHADGAGSKVIGDL